MNMKESNLYLKFLFLFIIFSASIYYLFIPSNDNYNNALLDSKNAPVHKKFDQIIDRNFNDLNNNKSWDPGEDLLGLNKSNKFVTIGGSVTEIVFLLGYGQNIIAVDQSSTFPEKVKDLPQVGYIRNISSEGVLSMLPTRIFSTTAMGPPNAVNKIKNSGVNVEIFKDPKSIDEINKLIDDIAIKLDFEDGAKRIKDELNQSLELIGNIISKYNKVPKMAFFMNPSTGSYTAAGSNTNANYMILSLGGLNVFLDDFSKYKKVDKEQILKYNPDVIFVANYNPEQRASLHFINNKEFQLLECINKNNIIDIEMSDLTMGPSFPSNMLSILKRINIDFK